MHRSRLYGIIVEIGDDATTAAVANGFWSAALGSAPRPGTAEPHTPAPSSHTAAGAPRVHVDIETDDVDAEVRRLCGALDLAADTRTWHD
jgi:hypothetical protein